MTKNSENPVTDLVGVIRRAEPQGRYSRSQLRLRIIAGALLLLNAAALYFYLSPPGGTREELETEQSQTVAEIASAKIQATRLEKLASNVETGSTQAVAFENKYFLPKRTAYVAVLEEIQRMAKASGMAERDATWNEEPIEGTADLTLLNITANYEGTNENLMKFLHESDQSPMLLILDALTASPQQKNNQINALIRFQAIVREVNPGVQQ